MLANYSAYSLNFLSGLILARTLGVDQRGTLAFISTFYLITLLVVPLNSRNGSSFASIKNSNRTSITTHFPFKKMFFRVFIVVATCTAIFDLILLKKIEPGYLIFFSVSNLACGLTFYIYFVEGIYRVKENILDLAVLRFLGLAVPSIYIFLLFALGKVEIKLVLLSQFLAVISCTIFLKSRGPLKISFRYDEYSEQVKKTFLGYALEYLANIVILISITFTSSTKTIGYFAIAMSFAMISETFYPVVESRMLNMIKTLIASGDSPNLNPLVTAIKEIVLSQLIFIPLAFAIPAIYGKEYGQSVYFAIVLIFAKCIYSIVKLCNNYAVISDRFNVPIILNSIYLLVYIVSFYILQTLDLQISWQISSILASLFVASIGFMLIRRKKPKYMIRSTAERNLGSEIV
jgi:O-antigen/teichoic acid export membrane protein